MNAAIRRHLQADDLAVAVVTRDAAGFRDRLLANEPSPPTYNAAVTEEIRAEDALIEAFELAVNPDRVQVVPVEEMFRRGFPRAPDRSVRGTRPTVTRKDGDGIALPRAKRRKPPKAGRGGMQSANPTRSLS